MAKFTREGRFYAKYFNAVNWIADGNSKSFFCKVIPPYVVISKAWITLWIHGTSDQKLYEKTEIDISGRMGNMTLPSTNDHNWNESHYDSLDEMTEFYLPRYNPPTMMNEADYVDDNIIELGANKQNMTQYAKDREFMHYSKTYGIDNNSLTSPDKYTISDKYTTEKNITGYKCNVDQYRLLTMDIALNAMESATANDYNDPKKHMFGNTDQNGEAGQLLTQDAFEFFGDQGAKAEQTPSSYMLGTMDRSADSTDQTAGGHDDVYADNSFVQWATQSYVEDDGVLAGIFAQDSAEDSVTQHASNVPLLGDVFRRSGIIQAKVTLAGNTIKPKIRNLWTPD